MRKVAFLLIMVSLGSIAQERLVIALPDKYIFTSNVKRECEKDNKFPICSELNYRANGVTTYCNSDTSDCQLLKNHHTLHYFIAQERGLKPSEVGPETQQAIFKNGEWSRYAEYSLAGSSSSASLFPKEPINRPKQPFVLVTPDRSNPAITAFEKWLDTQLKNDFSTFIALTLPMKNLSEQEQRERFDELRIHAPTEIMIFMPWQPKKDDYLRFDVFGCDGKNLVTVMVMMMRVEGTWRVMMPVWRPGWNYSDNKDALEVLKCEA